MPRRCLFTTTHPIARRCHRCHHYHRRFAKPDLIAPRRPPRRPLELSLLHHRFAKPDPITTRRPHRRSQATAIYQKNGTQARPQGELRAAVRGSLRKPMPHRPLELPLLHRRFTKSDVIPAAPPAPPHPYTPYRHFTFSTAVDPLHYTRHCATHRRQCRAVAVLPLPTPSPAAATVAAVATTVLPSPT